VRIAVEWNRPRPQEAVLEQRWPRQAPRVLLGYAILLRWWRALRAR
jgi:hypothetical protein